MYELTEFLPSEFEIDGVDDAVSRVKQLVKLIGSMVRRICAPENVSLANAIILLLRRMKPLEKLLIGAESHDFQKKTLVRNCELIKKWCARDQKTDIDEWAGIVGEHLMQQELTDVFGKDEEDEDGDASESEECQTYISLVVRDAIRNVLLYVSLPENSHVYDEVLKHKQGKQDVQELQDEKKHVQISESSESPESSESGKSSSPSFNVTAITKPGWYLAKPVPESQELFIPIAGPWTNPEALKTLHKKDFLGFPNSLLIHVAIGY